VAHFEAASLCLAADIVKVELVPPVTLHSQVYCLLQLQKNAAVVIKTEKNAFILNSLMVV